MYGNRIQRSAARICAFAALSVIPMMVLTPAAHAATEDSAIEVSQAQDYSRPHYPGTYPQPPHHPQSPWWNNYPGPPDLVLPPLGYDPFPRDPWRGRPGQPPRVCTGSFGSC